MGSARGSERERERERARERESERERERRSEVALPKDSDIVAVILLQRYCCSDIVAAILLQRYCCSEALPKDNFTYRYVTSRGRGRQR